MADRPTDHDAHVALRIAMQRATLEAGDHREHVDAWRRARRAPYVGKLRELQGELVASVTRGRHSDAESREWGRLDPAYRAVLLFMGGVDGDVDVLAQRHWRELPEPERQAVKSEARTFRKAMLSLTSLTLRT